MYHRNLWEKAVETDTPECKGTVPNLIEGMDYQFRIIAVNRAGSGEPSEPCRPVTAKPRFCKCTCATSEYIVVCVLGDMFPQCLAAQVCG